MLEALGAAPDRDAVLVRFAEVVTSSEASVLRQALDGVAGEPGTANPASGPKAPT
jgi:hypothetical protein